MLATRPISRTHRFAIRRPAVADAPTVDVVDGIVVGLIALTVLALVAPSLALAVLVAAGVVGSLVLAFRVGTASPVVDEADRIAVALAMKANYSFNR
jgi:uncharacterized membrane protein YdcZ (DUF606 family)